MEILSIAGLNLGFENECRRSKVPSFVPAVVCGRRTRQRGPDSGGGLMSIEEEGVVGQIFFFLNPEDGLELSSASRKLLEFRRAVRVRRMSCLYGERWGTRHFISRLYSYPFLREVVLTGGGLKAADLRILFETIGKIWVTKKDDDDKYGTPTQSGCICECHLPRAVGLAVVRLDWNHHSAMAGWNVVASMLRAGGCPTVQILDLSTAPMILERKTDPSTPRSSEETCRGVSGVPATATSEFRFATHVAESLVEGAGDKISLRRFVLPHGSYRGLSTGLLERMAKLDIADAACELGRRYEESPQPIEGDVMEAEAWYAQAARLGMTEGAFRVGIISRDRRITMFYLGWAAARGHRAAQLELGRQCLRGHCYKDAVRWLSNAGQAGLAEAMSLLGDIYAGGFEGQEDGIEAVRLYRLALEMSADSSDPETLGKARKGALMCPSMTGGEVDVLHGTDAAVPLTPSQYACVAYQLGIMSMVGRGCPVDLLEAKRMFQHVVNHEANETDVAQLPANTYAGARYFLSLVILHEFQTFLSASSQAENQGCGSKTACLLGPRDLASAKTMLDGAASLLHESALAGHTQASALLKGQVRRALALVDALSDDRGEGDVVVGGRTGTQLRMKRAKGTRATLKSRKWCPVQTGCGQIAGIMGGNVCGRGALLKELGALRLVPWVL